MLVVCFVLINKGQQLNTLDYNQASISHQRRWPGCACAAGQTLAPCALNASNSFALSFSLVNVIPLCLFGNTDERRWDQTVKLATPRQIEVPSVSSGLQKLRTGPHETLFCSE
jgi:hypothetical protein